MYFSRLNHQKSGQSQKCDKLLSGSLPQSRLFWFKFLTKKSRLGILSMQKFAGCFVKRKIIIVLFFVNTIIKTGFAEVSFSPHHSVLSLVLDGLHQNFPPSGYVNKSQQHLKNWDCQELKRGPQGEKQPLQIIYPLY